MGQPPQSGKAVLFVGAPPSGTREGPAILPPRNRGLGPSRPSGLVSQAPPRLPPPSYHRPGGDASEIP